MAAELLQAEFDTMPLTERLAGTGPEAARSRISVSRS